MISELLGRSLKHHCNFYVVIDRASTCWPTFANKIQQPERSITEVHSRSKLIVHHSLQQTNVSRCSVRLVLLFEESPHPEPILFLKRNAPRSFAAHQNSQRCCDASGHDLFSRRQHRPYDRLTHVCRLFQESLRISLKPESQFENLNEKFVETTGFTIPLLWSLQTSV